MYKKELPQYFQSIDTIDDFSVFSKKDKSQLAARIRRPQSVVAQS